MDLSLWHILNLIDQGAAPVRGRSLLSTTAVFAVRSFEQSVCYT